MGCGTTRYWHHFTQYAEEINGSYIPDPISTYAGVAVANNSDIGSHVVETLQNGKATKLRRYYQYASHRFGNRGWNWKIQTTTGNVGEKKITSNVIKALLNSSKSYLYPASVTTEFNRLGPYINKVVKDTYGIDEFNNTYQGKSYMSSDIKEYPEGWSVLRNITDNSPKFLYLNSLPEPSRGIIYWDYSQEPKLLDTTKSKKTYENPPRKYSKSNNNRILVKEWADPYNPFGANNSSKTEIDSSTEEELNKQQKDNSIVDRVDTRKFYKMYATLRHTHIPPSSDDPTTYEYIEEIETYELTYDTEKILYVTESGLTNSDALTYYFNSIRTPTQNTSNVYTNTNDPYRFKFYPYVPLQDFGADAWEQVWLVPKLSKNSEIIKLQSIVDKAAEDTENLAYQEVHEPNQVNSRLPSKDKKAAKKKRSKKYTYNGKQYPLSALQRKLNRLLALHRRIKFNKLYNPSKELTESATKRHIEHMADLLEVSYHSLATSMVADKDYSNGSTSIKGRNIMPAVKFSSPLYEVQGYWYYFFKRLYKMYGEESDFTNWRLALTNAESFADLPMKTLTWVNQSGLDYGGMSWLFIRKFQIKGNIRSIHKIKHIKEIKRGKPTNLTTLDELKDMVEPLHELADDKYYTSKNKTMHCVGGQKYNASGTDSNSIHHVIKDYDYTFFCKQISKDTLDVIAVAGLCFSTKMINVSAWARAWYDLELQYKRNANKYGSSKDKNFSALFERKMRLNKRHYYITKIAHFGVMPLDYNVIRKIGTVELERLAVRATLLYGFTHTEVKGKSKGFTRIVKIATKVLQIALTVASLLLALPTGGQSLSLKVIGDAIAKLTIGQIVKMLVTAVVVNVAMQLAMKHVVLPLLRALGLKGLIAILVIIVIIVIASMLGGQPSDTQSALPYMSEVGKQTATQATKEAVNTSIFKSIEQGFQSLSKSISEMTLKSFTSAVKEGVNGALTQLTNMSGFQIANQLAQADIAAINQIQQKDSSNLQAQMEAENERFQQASKELEERMEKLNNTQQDIKEVLKALRLRFKMYEPQQFLTANITPDLSVGSFDYLSSFLSMKLNVEPSTTDVAMTPDFTFNKLQTI